MGRDTPALRLFVAAYPPEALARQMLEAARRLGPSDCRWTPVDQVHLTLQFMGRVPPREVDEVCEGIERSGAGLGPMLLTCERLITLPERGRPRLVALETDAPSALLELKRRLASRLARNVRPDPAGRFRPHLTLCRFSRSARPTRVNEPVSLEPFRIDRIRLMRSELRPDGAHHAEIGVFQLLGDSKA
ncbi:MAG: RNA 2',3'-cyclic phosphodiesterase [Phycisphaerales bacterium JB059]